MKTEGRTLFPVCSLALFFVALFALGWALHEVGFHQPMVYDAREWIANRVQVFASHNLRDVLGIVPARPLFMLSLYGNFLLTGMDPYYFRVFNVMLVALAGVALTLLSAMVFELPGVSVGESKTSRRAVSVFLGLYFAVHPLQSFVVLYDWQREAIMGCLFYYGALAAYLAGRSGSGRPAAAAYALSGILFLAGLMSKENLATLPLVLILAEIILFRQGLGQIVRRAGAIAAAALPVFLIYFVAAHNLHGSGSVHPQGVLDRLHEYYYGSGLTPLQVGFTECRVWFSYLFMILAPWAQGVHLLRAETVSTSLWHPAATFAAVGGMLIMVALGIGLARKRPVTAFGLLFFLATLLPESLLIPTYLFAGYRAILPMAGILLVVGDLLLTLGIWCAARWSERTVVMGGAALLAVPALFMGAMTLEQGRRWNPVSFWNDAFLRLPQPPGRVETIAFLDIINGLGSELVNAGSYSEAIAVLKRGEQIPAGGSGNAEGAALVPKQAPILANLALAYKQTGNLTKAMQCYGKALEIDPRSPIVVNNFALALEAAGDLDLAEQNFKKALDLAPNNPEFHFNLGCLFMKENRLAEAGSSFKRALELNSDYAEAHANLGLVSFRQDRPEEAIANIEKAIVRLSGTVELHNTLGVAYAETGRTTEAIKSFQRALALQPNHPVALRNLEILRRESQKGSDRRK